MEFLRSESKTWDLVGRSSEFESYMRATWATSYRLARYFVVLEILLVRVFGELEVFCIGI